MFSALKQGSIVYILEKTDRLTYKTGQVITASSPQFPSTVFSPNQPVGGVVNISVNVGGNKLDFSNLPAGQNITNYNNGTTIISESKDAIMTALDNVIAEHKSIVDNYEYSKLIISDGEEIKKQQNPNFAKEKKRDEEIDNLNKRVSNMDDKLNEILSALRGGNSN